MGRACAGLCLWVCAVGTWTIHIRTKCIRTKCIGPKRIGDKTYWRRNYWRQNLSATKSIGDKAYRQTILIRRDVSGQNVSADKMYRQAESISVQKVSAEKKYLGTLCSIKKCTWGADKTYWQTKKESSACRQESYIRTNCSRRHIK